MSEITAWWQANGRLVIALAVQAVFVIVWGVKLEARVSAIEQHAVLELAALTTKVSGMAHRLDIIEDRQNNARDSLVAIQDLVKQMTQTLERRK